MDQGGTRLKTGTQEAGLTEDQRSVWKVMGIQKLIHF